MPVVLARICTYPAYQRPDPHARRFAIQAGRSRRARRAWRRLAEAVVAGTGTAMLMLGVYEGFDARAVVPGLTAYWAGYYLPATHGLRASSTFVISRFNAVHAFFGLGPVWLGVRCS